MVNHRELSKKCLITFVVGMTASSLIGCSTLIKGVLNSIEGGRIISKVIAKTYSSSITEDTKAILPSDFTERVFREAEHSKPVVVRIAVPGFATPLERYGSFEELSTPLGQMHEAFEGKIIALDYPSKKSVEENAKEISIVLNNINNQFPEDSIVWDVMAFSAAGNIFTEIDRENYCDNIKRINFFASPLNGVKFIFPTDSILNNYNTVLNLNKEESKNFHQLFEKKYNPLLKKFETPPVREEGLDGNKKDEIIFQYFALSNDSRNPFVKGKSYILGDDDGVVALDSQLKFLNYGTFGGVKIYKGYGLDHVNALLNNFVMQDFYKTLKEGFSTQNKPNGLEDITVVEVPSSKKVSKDILPDMNSFLLQE